jgi:hypothetical protein
MQKNDIQLALFQCFTRILANLQPNLKTLCLWHILQPQFYTGYSSLILALFRLILDHIYIWLDTLLILSNRVHRNWSYAFVQWCAYSAFIIVSPIVNSICLPCTGHPFSNGNGCGYCCGVDLLLLNSGASLLFQSSLYRCVVGGSV